LHLEAKLKAERAQRRVAAQQAHSELTTGMPQTEDISAALVSGGVTLLDLIPSGGAAARVNGHGDSVLGEVNMDTRVRCRIRGDQS
jgi:light-regulated signal transduction histidine kinase (bacteriophytochrome)